MNATRTSIEGTAWTIRGSDDEPIIGNAHVPLGQPAGVIVIAHGFKGYKDYGMFPALARHAAAAGFISHRFNFSHSGMTNDIDTFARPELFERDTWSHQVFDLRAVLRGIQTGELLGRDLPVVVVGHSRGGVTALLAVGRPDWPMDLHRPAGVMTLAAPSSANSLDAATQAHLLAEGRIVSPSSRTGQMLHVGSSWLLEQRADPAGHDVAACAQRLGCPLSCVHGDADDAVPVSALNDLARAVPLAAMHRIEGANHVFNTPNPMPIHAEPSEALCAVMEVMIAFARSSC
jgi:alpha-beta hydrolase superfamily lysophospholipase